MTKTEARTETRTDDMVDPIQVTEEDGEMKMRFMDSAVKTSVAICSVLGMAVTLY